MLLSEMSDDDLIFLINAKSQLAEKELLTRYMGIAKIVAREYEESFTDAGIPYEDYYAICISSIYTALRTYSNRTVAFKRYWKIVTRNAIYDYVRDNSYRIGALPLSGVSLEDTCYKESDSIRFHETVADVNPGNSLYDFLYEYAYGDNEYFTDDEKKLIKHHYLGELSVNEFVAMTGWSRSKMTYIVKSARRKIKEILKDNYF